MISSSYDRGERPLLEKARELGFEAVGVARAEALTAEGSRLVEWLAAGYQGTMRWLERDPTVRADPRALLPGAKSVIVVAETYPAAVPGLPIARYAMGIDYHRRFRTKLRWLRQWLIHKIPDAHAKITVDSSPMMETAWARRAGIGWQGKHTLVLRPGLGSWFLLGTLITDIELTPDAPMSDRCGTCQRCMDVCPTRAIVAPYTIDARRCISYLTIEHEGPIPEELRPLMGRHIFGCDLCQTACPWNKHSGRGDCFAEFTLSEANVLAMTGDTVAQLGPLLLLTAAEFEERFRHTALFRTGRDRFCRNVAVALGNTHDRAAVPYLAKGLQDASPLVRSHCSWALAEIQAKEGQRAATLSCDRGLRIHRIAHGRSAGRSRSSRAGNRSSGSSRA